MAAVNITIDGVLCDKYGRTITPVKLVGEATLTGLGVGGGPIMPPGNGGGGGNGKPPGIWGGGNTPMPTPPIANVPGIDNPDPPGKPDVPPPTVWPPGPGIDWPEHPIVLPPDEGVIPPGTLVTWKPVWTPDDGWMVVGFPNIPHPAPSAG